MRMISAIRTVFMGHKLMMEEFALRYRDAGLEVCCLRIGNVISADSLPMTYASEMGSHICIECFEDGRGPARSYIVPSTLADVIGQLCDHEGALPYILNVGAPSPTHMEDLTKAAVLRWGAG